MATHPALLLIDVMAGAFQDDSLRNGRDEPVLPCLVRLLARAHGGGALVVHVVEDLDEAKHPPGSPLGKAYQIHPDVAPLPGEPVIRQHHYDAFLDSGLAEILEGEGVRTVVVAGIASPWCVDNAVSRAHRLGYRVILAEDGHGCATARSSLRPRSPATTTRSSQRVSRRWFRSRRSSSSPGRSPAVRRLAVYSPRYTSRRFATRTINTTKTSSRMV